MTATWRAAPSCLELKFVYEGAEGFQALPTFGVHVVIPSAALVASMNMPGLTFNPMMLLHGEQYMEVRKPLPTAGTLTSQPRIAALYDKGSGALMVLEVRTTNEAGEEILFNQYSLFIRGLGGFGGDKGPAPVKNDPPAQTPPEVVHRERTLGRQSIVT